MMLMIRLQRFGKKNQPSFRVVVTDKRNGPRSGNAKEVIGWSNPRAHTHVIDKEKALFWLGKGAEASGTVHNMLVRDGVIKGAKIDVAPKVKPVDSAQGEPSSGGEAGAEAPKEAVAEGEVK
ncbi:MAG: 30S ribosomal protein S16 [Parcubacteria group bacterium]|nr:30S ribosomal protein S16 [Parcubacteria group bacterium]